MERSKLEVCVAICEAVALEGPLKPEKITSRIKLDRRTLNQCLDLLVTQNMIKRSTYKTGEIYTINGRGSGVLKFFRKVP
jgi:predicted transcriptional regulator